MAMNGLQINDQSSESLFRPEGCELDPEEISYCVLCLGAVDWHNCGGILGAWKLDWD